MKDDKIIDIVKNGISSDTIVFDKNDISNGTKTIISDMKNIINDSFQKLYADSDKIYNNQYDNYNYSKNGNVEVLINGPIKYTSYNVQGYPKNTVHKIEVFNISY